MNSPLAFFRMTSGCVSLLAYSLALPLGAAEVEPRSLNAGLPASFDPAPNYRLCTDEGDPWQLSDGAMLGQRSSFEGKSANLPEMLPGMTGEERANVSLWGQKASVGWVHPRQPILVTFDLKKEERIGSIALSSAAGTSGVYWATAVGIAVSADGERWSYVGDLIALSRRHGLPPASGYSAHLFRAEDLNVEGRYVALCIFPGSTSMFFTDEIAIYAGKRSGSPQKVQKIGSVAQLRDYVKETVAPNLLARRLTLDAGIISAAIGVADEITPEQRDEFRERLQAIHQEHEEVPTGLPLPLRTVIPITPEQTKLLALHGELLRARGYPPLLASKVHRNAYVRWLTPPKLEASTSLQLTFRQMRNETRSDLFLLTNATPDSQSVRIEVTDTEGLELSTCPWSDTPQLEPVATALLPARRVEGGWEVEVPAGLTQKLYLTADASKLPEGQTHRQLTIRGAGEPIAMDIRLDISSVSMGAERLHLGMWDYTTGDGYDSLTPQNRDAAIRLMRAQGVDSPWAVPRITPLPNPEDFDRDDTLRRFPDYTELDRWIARWPDARRYMLFVSVGSAIGGIPMDSPRFNRRVTQWAQHLADHAAKLGLKPGQLHLCLVDEPHNDQTEKRAAAWAAPIRESVPALTVWSNPVAVRPTASANPSVYTLPQVLCPNLGVLRRGGEKAWSFFRDRRESGQAMELYLCSALAPHTDPNGYFRLLALAGWRLRIQGIGFWAFHSQGGLADAFSAYHPTKNAIWYSPAFLHSADATDTLQLQAVRESLLDYEYLRALESKLPSITDPTRLEEAKALLSDEAINALIDTRKPGKSIEWSESANWEEPDRFRIKILNLLEQI